MKQYNQSVEITPAGRHALESYARFQHEDKTWFIHHRVSVIIPHEQSLVKAFLLETEHMGKWLNNKDLDDLPLPDYFAQGQLISKGRNNYGCSYLMSYQPNNYRKEPFLVIMRPIYTNYRPYYFSFTTESHQRYSTKLTIHATDSQKYRPSLIERMKGQISSDSNGAKQLDFQLKEILSRFEEACEDRVNFGPIYTHLFTDRYWSSWRGEPGVIEFYPNRNGSANPEMGEHIKTDEVIGFVYPKDKAYEKELWKQRNPIKPGSGFVRRCRKKSGDMIERDERIMLLSSVANEDLGEVALRSSDLYLVAKNPFSLRLNKFCVAKGAKVAQHDPIALFEGDDGKLYRLKSKASGVLTKYLCEPGNRCYEQDRIIGFKFDVLKA